MRVQVSTSLRPFLFFIICGILVALFAISNNASAFSMLLGLGLMTCVAILVSPLLGLAILTAVLPLYGLMVIIPQALTLPKALAFATAISASFRLDARIIENCVRSKILRWFMLTTLISIVLLTSNSTSLEALEQFSTVALLGFLPVLVFITIEDLSQLRLIALTAALITILLAIFILIFGIDLLEGDVNKRLAVGTNENELSYTFCVFLSMIPILWYRGTFSMRFVCLLSILSILLCVILSQSRGMWIGITLATFCTLVFSRQLDWKTKLAISFLFCLLICSTVTLLVYDIVPNYSKLILDRFDSLLAPTDNSSLSRIQFIFPFWFHIFEENPIFGMGVMSKYSLQLNPHNDLLSLLGERGLVGFTVYAVFMSVCFREVGKIRYPFFKTTSTWLLFFMIAAGLFHETLWMKSYAFAIGILATICKLNITSQLRS